MPKPPRAKVTPISRVSHKADQSRMMPTVPIDTAAATQGPRWADDLDEATNAVPPEVSATVEAKAAAKHTTEVENFPAVPAFPKLGEVQDERNSMVGVEHNTFETMQADLDRKLARP